MKRKGISLIVLIITIVVIIILGTAIVVNIAKANVINNANEAVLKSDVANLKSELEIYVTDQFVSNKGKYDRQNLNADVGQAKYNEERMFIEFDGGKGVYVSNGTYEDITWEKGAATDSFKFYGADGKELKLNIGKTYVGITDSDNASSTVIA